MKPAFVASAVLLLLTTSAPLAVAQDEMPQELLLRCELNDATSTNVDGKIKFDESTETKDFHLKDGTFEFTSGFVPLAVGCKLRGGKIACNYSRTLSTNSAEYGPSVEKRESYVMLIRATGEMTLGIRVRSYKGKVATATPNFDMVSNIKGVCRPIGAPLF